MGKATILQSLGAGLYRIKVEFDNALIEARKTAINDETTALNTELAAISPRKQAALDKFNADIAAMNDYINAMTPKDYENAQVLADLQAAAYKSKIDYDLIVRQEKGIKLKIMGLVKDKFYLDKYCPKEFEANAWCVAYNEGLSGVTKTIEVDYLLERDVITNFPRHDTGFWLPETVQAPDSQLQHPLESSVHAVWFNLAMFPAAQRDKGRFRIAIITSLNKDTDKCNLWFYGYYDFRESISTLVDDKPVFPYFLANDAKQQNYVDADVLYMTCNAEAFEVGDKVIVDLHEGVGVPTVIGFYENPRKCLIFPIFTVSDQPEMGLPHPHGSIFLYCDWKGLSANEIKINSVVTINGLTATVDILFGNVIFQIFSGSSDGSYRLFNLSSTGAFLNNDFGGGNGYPIVTTIEYKYNDLLIMDAVFFVINSNNIAILNNLKSMALLPNTLSGTYVTVN